MSKYATAAAGKLMRIVADANMCDVAAVFSSLGSVEELDGRAIGNADLRDAEILLVRSVTRVDAALLDNTAVRFVGTATSGFDHIDRQALERRGIQFAYAAGCNANSVLEYVISAIASCDDKLERLCAGERVGIIGYGVIGRRLQQRLHALGIDCVAYDPWLDQSADTVLVALDEVLACAVISIHAQLTERQPYPSVHLLNRETLSRIPGDSLVISAGRGAIVDNQALLRVLRGDSCFSAVLDVWEHEPEVEPELLARCRYTTPHIAGYSHTGKLLATRMLYRQACTALGLEPDDTDPDSAPGAGLEAATGLEVPAGLAVPTELGGAALIRWLQQQSYEISVDDARMRAELGQGFDRLRRLYPLRRELADFPLINFQALSAPAQQVCVAMGCRIP
ncbi:MAG: 4-phosphoerythronate dehydrogenase [Gammaproteobacteria bacterium]|nr:4-phosphoerythronate dehydrogenase [Gammaproteobacteria bacterium]